jgi:type IV secretory pathway VirB4 component
MKAWIEKLITRVWNMRLTRRQTRINLPRVLDLAAMFSEDTGTQGRITLSMGKRAEHIAILGRTGSGKSSLIKYLAKQDIESGRGGVLLRPSRRRNAVSAFDLCSRGTPHRQRFERQTSRH